VLNGIEMLFWGVVWGVAYILDRHLGAGMVQRPGRRLLRCLEAPVPRDAACRSREKKLERSDGGL
jgi:hypothetical protein